MYVHVHVHVRLHVVHLYQRNRDGQKVRLSADGALIESAEGISYIYSLVQHDLHFNANNNVFFPFISQYSFFFRYLLGEKNLFGFEMVANLNSLPPRGATVYAFPMKIYDGSGAPVRMFAFWNNSGCDFKPSTTLLIPLVLSLFFFNH
jgi:hypothetical protein